jgi:hypothetical protein
MQVEQAKANDIVTSTVTRTGSTADTAHAGGVFHFECYDMNGNLKWKDSCHNLVVNVGLKFINDTVLTGSGYTAAWYVGLITGPAVDTTISAGDTLASHGATGAGGWTEDTNYSGSRPAITFGAATTANPAVSTNGTAVQFTMNGTTTVAGAFLANVASGTSGTLLCASDFQSPGDRSVVSGDVLNVTYTFNMAA